MVLKDWSKKASLFSLEGNDSLKSTYVLIRLCLQLIKAYFYLEYKLFALTDMKMTATCLLLPDVFGDDPSLFVIVNEKVRCTSVITGLSFHIIIIYWKAGHWSILKGVFVIFTNTTCANKLIYCNTIVKLRHFVLFSYFTYHRVVTLLFFSRCKCPHPC